VLTRPFTGRDRTLAVFGALALLAAALVSSTPAPANATTSYTIARTGGTGNDGSDSGTAIIYTITLTNFDCTAGSGFSSVNLDVSGIAGGPLNKHFEIQLNFAGPTTNTTGCTAINSNFNVPLSDFSGDPSSALIRIQEHRLLSSDSCKRLTLCRVREVG
jgi:hypothetical protein